MNWGKIPQYKDNKVQVKCSKAKANQFSQVQNGYVICPLCTFPSLIFIHQHTELRKMAESQIQVTLSSYSLKPTEV